MVEALREKENIVDLVNFMKKRRTRNYKGIFG